MAGSTLQPSQNGTNQTGNRPRSGTAGSAEDPKVAPPVTTRHTRPTHLRSRSYLSGLSKAEPNSRTAGALPSEAIPPTQNGASRNKDAPTLAQRDSDSYINPPVPKIHLPGHRSRLSHDSAQNGKDDSAQHHRHKHMLSRVHSHRHTKSDVPSRWSLITNTGSEVNLPARNHSQTHLALPDAPLQHPAVTAAKGGMLTRISTNLSGKNVPGAQRKPRHQYSASDFHRSANPPTGAAFTGADSRPDLRRRATSDSKTPLDQKIRDGMTAGMAAKYGIASYIDGTVPLIQPERKPPLTEIERLLLRAERIRKEEEANITEADVQRMGTQLAESRVDLQEQLAANTRTASSLMRRLDDAHDMLVSTASSLIDTISSFQNLCQQSEALIGNFEQRANELDKGTRKNLAKQRKALFDERGDKIKALEERSRKAGEKAEEMSRRLENCRIVVRNFSEREQTKRRAWRGVMVGTLTGFIVIVVGLLLGVSLWWYKSYGGDVRYDAHEVIAAAFDQHRLGGANGHLDELVKDRIKEQVQEEAKWNIRVLDKVPKEVKSVLEDIAHRHNSTQASAVESEGVSKSEQYSPPEVTGDIDDDKNLRKLFEKLEL